MDFHQNSTVCDNLSDYPDIQDAVQKKVSDYNAYGTYFDLISTFAALYIGNADRHQCHCTPNHVALPSGPWSDLGRKPILVLPFIGHVLPGIVPLLVLYFERWPPTVLYLTGVYQFFGGYTLLSIAMNGYVGDVTTPR